MSCPLPKKPNLRVLLGHRITLPLPPHGHSGDLPTEHLVRVLVGRRVVVCSLFVFCKSMTCPLHKESKYEILGYKILSLTDQRAFR